MSEFSPSGTADGIAIVGMSGRFPGAKNVEAFWQNLVGGVESVTFFSDAELEGEGISRDLLNAPNYVKAGAVMDDIDMFDATFFGFSPREAEATDPQHRVFLECAWEALENAGYNPATYEGLIGVYAGAALNSYAMHSPSPNATGMQSLIASDKDFMTTRVSYKLNLKGPSVAVQTACSTSLVAVQFACQSLLNYQCDMALAGGISIILTQPAGYLYQPEGILSPDGHCRAVDAQAQGTLVGDGVGIVVLKRLEEALADRDYIYAVILGSAINNDGAMKVGYTAPSVDGQAEVVAMACAMAGVNPETIRYIEAHGTGTALGDPIEVAALTQVFRAHTQKQGFCGIGSLKTNVGHLNTAAGVASLMKAVLMLHHHTLVPNLHFTEPNPAIDFATSPFYVHAELADWPTGATPRRAGVSSFGIGGTNAHVILEEAPPISPANTATSDRPWHLLPISAKAPAALDAATANLTQYLKQLQSGKADGQPALADIAYTLQVGRQPFEHRRFAVCRTLDDAIAALEGADASRVFSAAHRASEGTASEVVFLFPDQGAQHVNMASELYRTEPLFRDQVDYCAHVLEPHLGMDWRQALYPDAATANDAMSLDQTALAQPALFVIEYALAQLWMSWGVRPEAMLGHSIGEYTAACLAGVFDLEDALRLVAARGQLMQELPGGAMLAVPLSEQEIQRYLQGPLSLAAINAPSRCVVSGPTDEIEALERQLSEQNLPARRLHTSHAFHSTMMTPILDAFKAQFTGITLHAPQMPYVPNVTGTWVRDAEATDPNYWVAHLRQPVRFAAGIDAVLQGSERILLEVGPGRTLTTLANQQPSRSAARAMLASLSHPQQDQPDDESLMQAMGNLWLAGVPVDWLGLHGEAPRRRVPLPTYPFERQRYWRAPQASVYDAATLGNALAPAAVQKKPDVADWFYMPSWKRSIAAALQPESTAAPSEDPACWLLFLNDHPLSAQLETHLRQSGHTVTTVTAGAGFAQLSPQAYTLNPESDADYDALFDTLQSQSCLPETVVHLWNLTAYRDLSLQQLEQAQDLGFHSIRALAQALGKVNPADTRQIVVVSNQMHEVTGDEPLSPEKAMILGPVRVIPQEYANLQCRSIDFAAPLSGTGNKDIWIEQLLTELKTKSDEPVIAYRGQHRWVQTVEPVRLDGTLEGHPRLFSFDPLLADGTLAGAPRLRAGGVYWITGGLGGIGLVLAEYLAKAAGAKLILTGRTEMPAKAEWDHWLDTHDENDRTSQRIRSVRGLESLGSEVLALTADVTNLEQMQNVADRALRQFGSIHGVIHAAGVAGGGLMQGKTRTEADAVLGPKVKGAWVLDAVLADIELDFFILSSSLVSIQGVFGQVDYAAGSAFLDAFAHYRSAKTNGFTTCINWDAWQEVGMAVNTPVPPELEAWRNETLRLGISPHEGVNAFSCIMGSRLPQVLVATHDLRARLEQSQAYSVMQLAEQANWAKPMHPRPDLSSTYVAPQNETEQTLADIWQELLGVEQVGVHDNFFELGGDSLLAILLNTRLRETFHIQITVQDLFSGPTITAMAERLQAADQREAEVIAEKLAMVEDLSDEEVAKLLAELKQST